MKVRSDNVKKFPSDQIKVILNTFVRNVVTCRQCGNKRRNRVYRNKKMRSYQFKCNKCGSTYSLAKGKKAL